ncbi:hypothetical protein [Parasphingorhabdus cellanae]|uniref:Fimbrial protein n=1 Tax=Parasphingorhabdus cellanae TaxID=2806553 RepID=A0ABX7T4U6_9SPHN|nr:hypothetical protein [Parasphingorhabdus cellanae]QTD55777.1 hypothetical protein J4G78_16550 [Parasphingorhabdus cellanae]
MMKPSLKIYAHLLGASLVLHAVPAVAQNDAMLLDDPCKLDLTAESSVDWRGLYGRGYEVFDEGQSFEAVALSVRHQGVACRFFLTAAPVSGGGVNALSGPGDPLYYDILKTTSGPSFLSADFEGSETSRIDGQFGQGQGVQGATLFVSIPANQFVRGGTYNGQAMIRLFRVDAGVQQLVAEAPLAILAPVASVLKVRSDDFPNGVRETSIDLGDLSRAARRSVDFNIMSNAEVAVTFQSANRGKLAHEAGAPGIGYSLLFRGENIDLSATAQSSRIKYMPNRMERAVPLEIVVPAPNGLPAAGQYNDALTVTFTAE